MIVSESIYTTIKTMVAHMKEKLNIQGDFNNNKGLDLWSAFHGSQSAL